jgi:hypothetical protein
MRHNGGSTIATCSQLRELGGGAAADGGKGWSTQRIAARPAIGGGVGPVLPAQPHRIPDAEHFSELASFRCRALWSNLK